MDSTSVRARAVRARLAEWWAGAWRWMLLAAGTAIGVYLLLDRGISNGVTTAPMTSAPMAIPLMAMPAPVSYTHLTLPTTERV